MSGVRVITLTFFAMMKHLNLDSQALHSCIFYDFRSGLNASQSYQRLCEAFEVEMVSRATVFMWLTQFKWAECSSKEELRSDQVGLEM